MLSTLRNAWKIPDLRKRMMFTLLMVVIIRMGIFIPVPGVDASKLVSLTSNGGTLFSFYDMLSGGAFRKFTETINPAIAPIAILTTTVENGSNSITTNTTAPLPTSAIRQGLASRKQKEWAWYWLT